MPTETTRTRQASGEVTLLEPFPVERLEDVHRWLQAYPLIGHQPGFPETPEKLIQAVSETEGRSWALVELETRDTVGFLLLTRYGIHGAQAFVASARRAWGTGWMQWAGREAICQAFCEDPVLGYIFGLVVGMNAPAAAYNLRVGMRLKNVLPNYNDQGDMLVYEITREQWEVG